MPVITGVLLPGLQELTTVDLLAEEVGAAFYIRDAKGGQYILEVKIPCHCVDTFGSMVQGVRVAEREEARVREHATDPNKLPRVGRFLRTDEPWDRGAEALTPSIVSIGRVR